MACSIAHAGVLLWQCKPSGVVCKASMPGQRTLTLEPKFAQCSYLRSASHARGNFLVLTTEDGFLPVCDKVQVVMPGDAAFSMLNNVSRAFLRELILSTGPWRGRPVSMPSYGSLVSAGLVSATVLAPLEDRTVQAGERIESKGSAP